MMVGRLPTTTHTHTHTHASGRHYGVYIIVFYNVYVTLHLHVCVTLLCSAQYARPERVTAVWPYQWYSVSTCYSSTGRISDAVLALLHHYWPYQWYCKSPQLPKVYICLQNCNLQVTCCIIRCFSHNKLSSSNVTSSYYCLLVLYKCFFLQ